MEQLASYGINPVSATYRDGNTAENGPLTGLTFVLTGALSRPRSEFERLITAAGGKATGSVTGKTNYLVAGDGGGSKRDKAIKLNIPIIGEEELLRMLKGDMA